MAIASTLKADTRVYTQGVRNFNDGVSYLSIGQKAAGELKTILFRVRELATQASNGTYGSQQRGAMDVEVQELQREYNRVLGAQGTIDSYLQEVGTFVGTIGAYSSRIQSAVSSIAARAENYAAAEGRIIDSDVAQESGTLLRTQILQQSAAAILAQANQQPALALTLLG